MRPEEKKGTYVRTLDDALKAASDFSVLPVLLVAINPDSTSAFLARHKGELALVAQYAFASSGVGQIYVQPFICCMTMKGGEAPRSEQLRDLTLMMSYPLWVVSVDPIPDANFSQRAKNFAELVLAVRGAFSVSTTREVAIGQAEQALE